MKSTKTSITDEQRKLIEDHIDVYLKDHPKVDYTNANTIASLRNSIAATTKLSNVLLIKPVTEILSSRLSSGDEANEYTASEASFEDPDVEYVESANQTEYIKGVVNTFGLCFGRSRIHKRDIAYLTVAVANELKCPPSDVSEDVQTLVNEYNNLHADDPSTSSECSDDDNINEEIVTINKNNADADDNADIKVNREAVLDSDDEYACNKKWSCSCVCQFICGLFVILVLMFGAVILSQFYF